MLRAGSRRGRSSSAAAAGELESTGDEGVRAGARVRREPAVDPRRSSRRTPLLAAEQARAGAARSSSRARAADRASPARLLGRRSTSARSSSSAPRSRIATRRSTASSPQLLVVGPLALAPRLARRLRARGRRAAAGRGDAPPGGRDLERACRPAAAAAPAQDEIRRLGETLNEMLDRLEAGLARERRFVADASHELRTPLALLRTELELALRQPALARGARAALRSAAEEVERLARLAEDLLVLARADDGGLPLRRDARRRCASCSTPSRGASRARRERRSADRGRRAGGRRSPATACGSSRRSATSSTTRCGTAPGRSGCARGDEDGAVELRVSDDGAGFPPDFLPHAFERFSRADEARGDGRPGSGSRSSRRSREAHGGTARPRTAREAARP